MKIFCIAAAICLGSAFTVSAQKVFLNPTEVQALKKLTVTNIAVKHLYAQQKKLADSSLLSTPNPIKLISSEGRLAGDPVKAATAAAMKDMYKLYALAIAYKMESNKAYLNKADEFFTAWASVNQPSADPIDDTKLDKLVESYDLLKKDLQPQTQKLVAGWLSRTAWAEVNSPKMKPGRKTAINNWNSHRLKIVGQIAYALGNGSLAQWTINELKNQIAINLTPEGYSTDFKLRDALSYHSYDLEPLLTLCIVIKRATGQDFYHYQSPIGSSVKKSTDWFVPYVDGRQQHAEFVHTTVGFDLARAKNKEPGHEIGIMYDPTKGIQTLSLASYFDKNMISSVQKAERSTSAYPNWQLVLNRVMQ